MKVNIKKQEKATLQINIIVENEKVKQAYDEILEETVKTTEIEGFRKGNAPKDMVEKKVGVSNLYGDVINKLLQTYYTQALKENKISPISNPKVEIKEFDIDKEFEFTATVATRPEIKIKDYKKALKEKFESKKKNLEKQKTEALKKGDLTSPKGLHQDKAKFPEPHLSANEVVEILLEKSEVEVADILIEEEADRLMGRLIDHLRGINLSLEKYLKVQDKTSEQLRKEYKEMSEKNIKAEFVLSHLIQKENVEVTDKEIEDMVGAMGNKATAQKMQSPMEKLYIKTILQKNKLISKLIEEASHSNATPTQEK